MSKQCCIALKNKVLFFIILILYFLYTKTVQNSHLKKQRNDNKSSFFNLSISFYTIISYNNWSVHELHAVFIITHDSLY